MTTDQLGGTTYTYPNITAFLANSRRRFSTPATSARRACSTTARRAAAHDAAVLRGRSRRTSGASSNLTFNYGLRYEYYTPLKGEDDLIVKFNLDTGQIDPNTTQLHGSKKDNFQPRVSMTYAPGGR